VKKRENPRNYKKKDDVNTPITDVPVFMAFVSVFSAIVKILIKNDNKSNKSLGGIEMKKLISLVVKQIEKHGEYIPFHLSEPVTTNSRK
jgi:hypothetical protein